jgi:hypothetical protein
MVFLAILAYTSKYIDTGLLGLYTCIWLISNPVLVKLQISLAIAPEGNRWG